MLVLRFYDSDLKFMNILYIYLEHILGYTKLSKLPLEIHCRSSIVFWAQNIHLWPQIHYLFIKQIYLDNQYPYTNGQINEGQFSHKPLFVFVIFCFMYLAYCIFSHFINFFLWLHFTRVSLMLRQRHFLSIVAMDFRFLAG